MTLEAQINEAVARAADEFARHPERRRDVAEQAASRNEPRPFPAFYLGRGPDIEAAEGMDRITPPRRTPEERLLSAVTGLTGGLRMHNPIQPTLWLGKGPGTLAASFGIEVVPELGYMPKGSRPLEALLADGMPDPAASGMLPEIREDIAAALAYTPDWIGLARPDMQGPFNIAHMLLGNEAFTAPDDQPEQFHALMTIITDFCMAVDANLRAWIGPARFPVFSPSRSIICECSVNLVSADFYREHLCEHDRRLVDYYGEAAIHPCSGPHVFRATLNGLPRITYHEAGYIAKSAAGAISVEDALAEIGDRPIVLSIGQELPAGEEEAFIRRDFDRAKTNSRLLFSYTGMHWKRRDEAAMCEMHLRLDDYWRDEVWSARA
jgi:hypothetical protein